ncbi:hypothetical protein CEXT_701191 [Caerostris extrusa]|uniref:Uncharacterized protein n=1 Tax=Caerostris extrusa TaxID=172846 RepID=A0AAV4NUC5_CAEEX|nr:hypothetical protein CEXT_701191 [Caerostris extrusa]
MTQAQNKSKESKKRVFRNCFVPCQHVREAFLPSFSPSMLLDGEDQDLSPLVLPRGDVTARNGINQVQLSHHPGPTFATARETNRRTASDSDARLLLLLGPKEYCVCLSSSWY